MGSLKAWWPIAIIGLITAAFYIRVGSGRLPIPSDDLLGLYHPFRDALVHKYPNGLPYKNFLITDPVRQQIPWRKLVIDQWKAGTFPGWDPTGFGGNPLQFNIQAAPLYPLNLLFLGLPFPVAWTLLIISQTLGMMGFTYWFLRRKGLNPGAALTGGTVVAFSGFSIAWLTWGTIVSTLMWLPLLLVAVEALFSGKRPFLWLIAIFLALVMSFTAGHTQIFFYSMIVVGLYALYQGGLSSQKRRLAWLSLPVGMFLLIFYPYLSAYVGYSVSSVRVSTRVDWHQDGFFIPFRHLLQFIVPDFFGNPATQNYFGVWNYGEMIGYAGIAGLLLAILSLKSSRKEKWFWWGLVGGGLLLATDNPLAHLPYIWKIPWISSLQPTRLLAVIDFSLAVLAAYGSECLVNQVKWFKRSAIILLGILMVLAIGVVVGHYPQAAISLKNMIIPGLITTSLVLIGFTGKHRWVVVILVIDLFRFGWKFTPFTPVSYFFPETKTIQFLQEQPGPFRIMTVNPEVLPTNSSAWYGLETMGGYNPLYPKRAAQYIHAMENPFIATNEVTFQRIIEPVQYKSPLARLANVTYVISLQPIQSDLLVPVLTEGKTHTYALKHALPRWYVADTIVKLPTDDAILEALTQSTFNKPAYVLDSVLAASGSGEVKAMRYESNDQLLEVTGEGGFLVNSTAWGSGWQATVDDQPVVIQKVNYLFMGIPVPPGNHRISFRYNRGYQLVR